MSMGGGLLKSFAHSIVVGEENEARRDGKTAAVVGDGGGAAGVDGEGFRVPLHYPRHVRSDYATMEEWKVDMLLREYGLVGFKGGLEEKRRFAMGAFLWPDQF